MSVRGCWEWGVYRCMDYFSRRTLYFSPAMLSSFVVPQPVQHCPAQQQAYWLDWAWLKAFISPLDYFQCLCYNTSLILRHSWVAFPHHCASFRDSCQVHLICHVCLSLIPPSSWQSVLVYQKEGLGRDRRKEGRKERKKGNHLRHIDADLKVWWFMSSLSEFFFHLKLKWIGLLTV